MTHHADLVTKFVEYVAGHKGALFHVTDEMNLPSISEHGLLSKMEAEVRGVVPAYPGGDSLTTALDRKHGLWNYVFLGFTELGVMPATRMIGIDDGREPYVSIRRSYKVPAYRLHSGARNTSGPSASTSGAQCGRWTIPGGDQSCQRGVNSDRLA